MPQRPAEAPTADWFWNGVRPIDAAVVREKLQQPVAGADATTNSVEVLERAVMIRGEAAGYLDRVLFSRVQTTELVAHTQD